MSNEAVAAQEKIFALDIGTRSVVGLIVEVSGEQFRVLDYAIQEHTERSMLDGQIHDVPAVARVIEQIKVQLEEKHGPLQQVAIAAAGRTLRTRRLRVDREVHRHTLLTKDDAVMLEFTAVQEAQKSLAQELNESDATRYYCVGYSVVNYFLDGEPIGSLIDQRGEIASVEVIATFLPRIVVDSLFAALKRCDLEMQALTLEPIAAINVLIPPTMRRLNIALVDIGAGTSDVALTAEGAITAYGMVPVAGDEITDALMNAFLLDFPVAESVKRQLTSGDKVQFQDILGIEHSLTGDEVVSAIENDVDQLAGKIAEKIIELNGKAPQAVMLIGGGSLTPLLPEKVAARLRLPAARVAVRGADALRQYIGELDELSGPEFVTPVGIAVAARRHPLKYITVTVNENTLRIFDLRTMTVGDALITLGMDIKRLYGRPGLAMTLTVNGRMRIIPGGHGTAPQITLNGRPAGIDEPLANGDVITVVPGEDGKEAKAAVVDLVEEVDTLDFFYNGEPVSLGPLAFVGGQQVPLDTPLNDRDQVEIRLPRTIREVSREIGLALPTGQTAKHEIQFSINGQSHTISDHLSQLLLDGRPVSPDDRIKSGDSLVYRDEPLPIPSIRDLISPEDWAQEEIRVRFNGQPVAIKTSLLTVMMDGETVSLDEKVRHGAIILVKVTPGPAPVFSDVFRYVNVSLEAKEGEGRTKLCTLINGSPASFQSPIVSGDELELYWE
ncbi:cell division FtsA domain-containing protein [Brevibacillus massiliensis]|uniref:cell division FtsA domain-containing protein n=1 Tax=Brevibacillus massiliensis TaxID=1118054 RepID=UPI0002ED6BC1|nr:cell division FtsA domain-containing protein [Brevibacillus massiliensis]